MNAIYEREQQLFSLCTLASIVSMKQASQEKLTELAEKGINEVLAHPDVDRYIGPWKLAWGPAVWVYNPEGKFQVADNVMFVAKHAGENKNRYVVSIAGTNPISWYTWLTQNFNVGESVEWPYLDKDFEQKPPPRISKGMMNGLGVLLEEMTDPNSDVSLLEFLQKELQNTEKPAELIVAGFSLGGALCQVLALALKYLLELDKEQISPIPFSVGGPSPGDQAFAYYYDNQMGPEASRLWNEKDIVPHAWQKDLLERAPDLYLPEIEAGAMIEGLYWWAIFCTKAQNYQHTIGKVLPDEKDMTPGNRRIKDNPSLLDFHQNQDQESFQKLLSMGLKYRNEQKSDLSTKNNSFSPEELAALLVQLLPSYLNPELHPPVSFTSLREKLGQEEIDELLEGSFKMVAYLERAFYEHMEAYTHLFHIEKFVEIYEKVKEKLETISI